MSTHTHTNSNKIGQVQSNLFSSSIFTNRVIFHYPPWAHTVAAEYHSSYETWNQFKYISLTWFPIGKLSTSPSYQHIDGKLIEIDKWQTYQTRKTEKHSGCKRKHTHTHSRINSADFFKCKRFVVDRHQWCTRHTNNIQKRFALVNGCRFNRTSTLHTIT